MRLAVQIACVSQNMGHIMKLGTPNNTVWVARFVVSLRNLLCNIETTPNHISHMVIAENFRTLQRESIAVSRSHRRKMHPCGQRKIPTYELHLYRAEHGMY